jgi:2-polyprenyl-6-hydroxyphenyl methylase / 3-demethylubiquinone-9 3-methyltransferase
MRAAREMQIRGRRLFGASVVVSLGALLSGCMSAPKDIVVPSLFAAAPVKAILEQEDRSRLGPRNLAFLPVRLSYLAQALQTHAIALNDLPVLVVNGGDSGIALALAATGARVTVLDADEAAIERAKSNAQSLSMASNMQFLTAKIEDGMNDGSTFSLVLVSNTFELTHGKAATMAALARTLKPGGLIVFDTINSSGPSKAIYLFAFQRFPPTSFVAPGTYADDRFVAPGALRELASAQGFGTESIRGFMPGDVWSLVTGLVGRKMGRVRDADLAGRAQMKLSESDDPPAVTYFGVLTKGEAR